MGYLHKREDTQEFPVVQWLGLGAFIAVARIQALVGELR